MASSPPEGRQPELLLAPRTAVPAALSVALATAAAAAIAGSLATDPTVSAAGRVAVAVVGGLLVVAGLAVSLRLGRPHGGVWWDARRAALGLGITSPRDTWWLPRSRLAGVSVDWRALDEQSDDVLWTARLELADGPSIVLIEAPDRAMASRAAERVAEAAGLEPVDAAEPVGPPRDGHVGLHVRRGVALHGLLTLNGASLLALGLVFFSQVAEHPVFAILFAPPIGLLGLALLVVVLARRLGREDIAYTKGAWRHRFLVGRRTLSARELSDGHARWQIRLRGLRGAALELVAGDEVLVLGAGATTTSAMDVEALAGVPSLFTPQPSDPPPS